ncbi:MAG: hypothetical protein M3016_03320 [Actinomycetota bacterium]|nr:hypothetical protein [Actinomycetota bacterium]
MSSVSKPSALILVALSALAIGAGAGAIASAGATPGAGGHHAGRQPALRGHGVRRLTRHAVHGSLVVPTGHGFATVTFDRGRVASVSGRTLTIIEGTPTRTYKTVSVSIPGTVRIRADRRPASLSALAPGQRVTVLTAPRRTLVIAHTAKRG